MASRKQVATLRGKHRPNSGFFAPSPSFSPDGSLLATSGKETALWDVASRKQVATFQGAFPSFSPDGSLLASSSWDSGIALWDVASRKQVATLRGKHRQQPSFSPDGSLLAIAGDSGIALWDVASRKQVATLRGKDKLFTQHQIYSPSFSPDGSLLAIAGDSGIALWDMASRQRITTLFEPAVDDLSFSPDGSLLAASSRYDEAVWLWDVSEWTGQPNLTYRPQARLTPNPAAVEFSADDPAWKTFTVHTNLDSVLVRANPSGSDPALEVAGGQQVPTRDYCPAEGNDRPTRGRRDGWSLHVKACQAGQTKILLIDYDTGEVVQQYEVNVEGTGASASTALNPSYPNPFNSETVLSYTLPTASDIRLEVFTLSGQRVAVLHEGFQAAGYHTLAMDASALASGVYLYRLTTPEGRFVQKFTLLR